MEAVVVEDKIADGKVVERVGWEYRLFGEDEGVDW